MHSVVVAAVVFGLGTTSGSAREIAVEVPIEIPIGAVDGRVENSHRAHAGEPEIAASRTGGCRDVLVVVPFGEQIQTTAGRVELIGNANWHGYSLAAVRVWGQTTPTLQLTTAPQQTPAVRRQRDIADARVAEQLQLGRWVANPLDVAAFAPPAPGSTVHKAGGHGFAPSAYPDLEGSQVDYLIVTDAALVDDFQVLADWKTRRGVPAVVRSLDFVLANARNGSDPAETLRNFVRDAYELWGVQWVLIGGDTGIMPVRFALVSSSFVSPPEEVPTDLYYACLDGTWNANGNHLFGEAATGAANLGDQVDLFPELYVARAPVSTTVEAQRVVNKIIQYETPSHSDYQRDALLLAEVLSPAAYDSGAAISIDGAQLTDDLAAAEFPAQIDARRLYETYFLYAGSQPLSKAAALDSLDRGPHWVNHMGHGFRFNMSVGDASIVNPEAEALVNGDRTFVLFLLNCTALAFDSNSLAERFMLAPAGGAVAVVGSSREAFPNTSIDYNEHFYNEIFSQGAVHLGEAVVNCRLPQTGLAFFNGLERWTHFILNVLGDPELLLFTDAPRIASVTHPASLSLDQQSVMVNVQAASLPVAGARVCLWKGDEAYAVGTTDLLGDVTLAARIDTPGSMLITVSGQNLHTYQGSIQALAPAAAHAYVSSHSVIDDGTSGSAGNGDGLIDVGETVAMQVQVGNNGGQLVTGLSAKLLLPGLLTAVLDSIALGDLGPGGSSSGTFVFQVGTNIADGARFDLPVQFFAGTMLGVEAVRKVVHAPFPEIVEVVKSVSGPTTSLQVVLKNFGTGAQSGFTGALTSTDPDVTIVSGATTLAPIASFGLQTSAALLQVDEANTSEKNLLHLELTDGYGRVLPFDFHLRGPAATPAPTLDASPGPTLMRAFWPASSDTTVIGYHLYRRPSGMGSLLRINTDVLPAAFFLDTGLSASTRYDYAVATVNESRLVSVLSPVATASTNPPQLAGWPLPMSAPTSSSVAIGDIDGDGDNEIVVGNAGVYAWHHDGTEVRDADNSALTWGLFTSHELTITGAVALAQLDLARPGLEIVAAAWADNRIFVYDGAGNLLPGWPVQPSNGGTPGYWGTPAAVDLDGDDVAEVLAISKDGRFYGFRADGSPLVAPGGSFGFVGGSTRTSPVAANIDADADLEIVISGSDGFLRAYNMDGSIPAMTQWPVNLGAASLAAPAAADIDGDAATPEFVVTSENNLLHVVDRFGVPLPGWPKGMPVDTSSYGPSPALADLNGDGRAEIVVVANATPAVISDVRIYDGASGALLLQRGLLNRSESSPILADVDGNGSVDVLVGGETGIINAWDLAGDPIAGFPLTVGDFVRGTPAFADVDGDGGAEVVLASWDASVYIWELGASFDAARAPWPTYHHDAARSGSSIASVPSDVGDPIASPLRRFALHPNVPNPFNPRTAIRFELPEARQVVVEIFDGGGRFVRRLHGGELGAGVHALPWNGHDHRGVSLATGVYWCRVVAGSESRTQKLLLLK